MNRRPFHPNPSLTVMTLLLLTLILTTTMAGCGSDGIEMAGGGTEVGNPKTFAAFADKAAMEGYLKTAYAENVLPENAYDTGGAPTGEDAASPIVTPDGASDYYPEPGPQTDEGVAPSAVLADDPLLHVATDGNVITVKAVPADGMTVAGALTIPGSVKALYKRGDILAAVYTPEGGEGTIREEARETQSARVGTPYWIPAGVRTGVLLADISDPAAPRTVRRGEFDGLPTAARRYDGDLVLATQFLPDLPDLAFQYEDNGAAPTEAVDGNRQTLADVPLGDLLPHYQTWDGGGEPVASGRLLEPQTLFRPKTAGGGGIVSLLTFRLDAPDAPFNRVGLAADIHGIHMAADAVYLAGVRWRGQNAAGASSYTTDIFRMTVSPGGVAPDAAGAVEGRLLDAPAMGADAGTLRIASALTETDGKVSEIAVSLMTADGNGLTTVGTLTQSSQDAAIAAARFDGPLGYIFTANGAAALLDLSAPHAPQAIGRISIGGQVALIRRLDEQHLLTVSRPDGGANGTLAIWGIGGTDGLALLHESALTVQDSETTLGTAGGAYDPIEGLLALPVSLVTPEDATSVFPASGVRLFRIDLQTGFENLGFIESPIDAANTGTAFGARPLFIDRTLYIVTADGVRAIGVSDALSPLGTILFNTL